MRSHPDVPCDSGRPRGAAEVELPRRWRSIWISDLHLGASACRAVLLLGLLRHLESEHLYLVGDVVHGTGLGDLHRWDPEHGEVVRALVERASRTNVVYVTGRDDAFLRRSAGQALGGVHVREEAVHATADGRALLVTHESRIDPAGGAPGVRCKFLGRGVERVRAALLGRGVEAPRQGQADVETERFERAVAGEARRRGLDGVVCGHVRRAGIRELEGVLYCNSGDWVESRTALVEDVRGKLALLRLRTSGSALATSGAG